jgi:hypothetical protein
VLSRSKNFFASIVEPTVVEFDREPLNLRRGRLAAIVVYHMADYWWNEHKAAYPKLADLHLHLVGRCPEFGVIRDVADASKHAELIGPQKRLPRKMTSTEQVQTTPGIFQAPFGTGVFREAAYIYAELDDGTKPPLLGAVRATIEMWRGLLAP